VSGHSKWANIKHKKARQDEKRGKEFTKIGRELMIAARQGGPDPDGNPRLKAVIQKARAANMPADTVQRNIQKGIGAGEGANYEEIVYEGYGPGGTAILVNIATDNRNRTASEMRYIFSRNGGSLGESGCVAWMFENRGVLTINLEGKDLDPDELLLAGIEAGADDVRFNEENVEIITAPKDLETVKNALELAGYEIDEAENSMLPKTTVTLADEGQARQMLRLYDALEDHDDVQNVYANFDIPDDIMEKLDQE